MLSPAKTRRSAAFGLSTQLSLKSYAQARLRAEASLRREGARTVIPMSAIGAISTFMITMIGTCMIIVVGTYKTG